MKYLGREYVEIGGLNWATYNLGADNPTDKGSYFQWGDVLGYAASQVGSGSRQKSFKWTDYKYAKNVNVEQYTADMTKYNSTDGKTVLEASDDAAKYYWGGNWRMPTREEWIALGNAVNTEWTADYQGSGVAGLICTDKNDSSKVLFFPACGFCSNDKVSYIGSFVNYWSSSLNSSNVKNAYFFMFNNSNVYWDSNVNRSRGVSVRGVFTGEPKDLTREELNYSSNAAAIYKENQYTLPVLTNTHSLSLTFSSSNINVATINSSGVVSIVGNGTTTISASFAGNNDYNAKTISYILIVDIKKYLDYKGLETFKQQLDIEFDKKANSSTVQSIIDDIGDNSTLNSVKGRIKVIEDKIPSAASSSNQLADKTFVNSSIATNTATYKGNYNVVSDLELSYNSTHLEIAQALALEISLADNNDYCFVLIPTSNSSYEEIKVIERYKFDGINWNYEYSLNNSGFTSNLWKAINSGITSELITTFNNKYDKPSGGIPKTDLSSTVQSSLDKADTALQLHQDISGKADKVATVSDVAYDGTNKKITKIINGTTSDVVTVSTIKTDLNLSKSDIGLDNVVNTGDSATPISGGTTKFTTGGAYTELAKKVDKVSGKGLSTNDYTDAEKNKVAANETAITTLQNTIKDNEQVTAAALDDLDDRLKEIETENPYSKLEIDNLLEPIIDKLDNIEEFAEVNVLSDWNQTDSSADDYIKNKPTSMPASDVSAWAKASSKPSYTKDEIGLSNVTNDALVKRSEMGVASGVATLDSAGKIPSSQLPDGITDVYTKTEIDNIITDNELIISSALNDLNTNKADKTSDLDGLKLKKITQAAYDALAVKDPNTLYIIVN